jgi:hypothetical protein
MEPADIGQQLEQCPGDDIEPGPAAAALSAL